MSKGRGNNANVLPLQGKAISGFRVAPPTPGTRAVVSAHPSHDGDRAHSFTKEDVAQHIASHLDADDLAAFESVIASVRG